MRIAEIYHSFQGEGLLTGTPSVFIRTSGCNLRCWFCDTPFTSWAPEGEHQPIDHIVATASRFECEHIVLTGGEPLLSRDVVELTEKLKDRGHFITIETAGTVDRPVVCDLMSISPKLANSTPEEQTGWQGRHDARRFRPDVVSRFLSDYNYQLKFVIDHPEDLQDVLTYLDDLPMVSNSCVYLMPQSRSPEELKTHLEWLIPLALPHAFQISNRLHIQTFGGKRGV